MLNTEQLKSLDSSLSQLPTTVTLKQCVELEGKSFSTWLKNKFKEEVKKVKKSDKATAFDKIMGEQLGISATISKKARTLFKEFTMKQIDDMIVQLLEDYATVAEISELPHKERDAKADKLYEENCCDQILIYY